MTRELVSMFAGLAKPELLKLRKRVSRIEDLEERGDVLLRSSLVKVFVHEHDAMAILVWQSTLEELDDISNSCDHVPNLAMSTAHDGD